MLRPLTAFALGVLFTGAIAAGAATGLRDGLGPPPLGEEIALSPIVVDRHGALLRPYTTKEGRWRLPTEAKAVDTRFLSVLLAYEDKRFFRHQGVDVLAMARAAGQLATHGRIVSGGSTISMQLARLLEPRDERSLGAKIRQVYRALQIERQLTKEQILTRYLTLAPYGGNIEGLRAASLAYFGKEPRRLSLGQAALLVALPQAPEVRRPDRAPKAARAARDRVLDRIAETGIFADSEIVRAKAETVPEGRYAMPMLAPHAADDAMAAAPETRIHTLTLERSFQARLEALAEKGADKIGPDASVAILVIDNETGEVRARVGTPDYFNARRAGQVDLTRAVRSPGSTLKPFIYGMGFEDGRIHPSTLIADRPVRFGAYAPENFDMQYQGTVTVRRALQLSLNVPAISVLEAVGPDRLVSRLGGAGTTLILPEHDNPGLALGLGGVGVTLTDLTQGFSGLARLGTVRPAVEREDAPRLPERRLLTPVAAWYVGNILKGAPPPESAAPGRIAFKTGTSYGYRDAWAVGYDGKYTIGVWAGRPDGAPVPGIVGRITAAPILFDAFARVEETPAPLPKPPEGVLSASSGALPPPLQRFSADPVAAEDVTPTLKILFPPDGASLALSSMDGALDPVAVKIAGGKPPLTMLVNGAPRSVSRPGETLFFEPDGPGFTRVTVTDAQGRADSVLVRLQ
ncbi:Penicillin-binding protein 1F [Methyloligella halotolerans]|uniref:peptidoglycan glycosyltransferase n=1 Tax=Methyloligella halotolerans TaxID=1177755 RepID=A0A1E2RVW6_9HYPH|nr:penicillin-binding protein 1C [Methyloligella halotolerans]ODA66377.1 Penicillin-binding protein 1F [Methyloligella halotolerans]